MFERQRAILPNSCPRSSSSNNLSLIPHPWDFNWECLTTICSSFLDLSMSSNKAQGLINFFRPLPHNSPSKLRFFPPLRGEKVGFWFLRQDQLIFWFTRVRMRFYMSHNCYWHFVIYKVLLITPGGFMSPASNSETPIQWLTFFPVFWAGVFPLIFPLYIKPWGNPFSSFLHKSSRASENPSAPS